MEQLRNQSRQKLDLALDKLKRQRNHIKQQQIPLARQIHQLENEIKQLKKKANDIQSVQDSKTLELEKLNEQVKIGEKEMNFILQNLLNDYSNQYETQLSIAEKERYKPSLNQLHDLIEDDSKTESDHLTTYLNMVRSSIKRTESLLGGKTFEGRSLNLHGKWVQGHFIHVGPFTYFSTTTPESSGLVQESLSLKPKALPMPSSETQLLQNFVSNGNGKLPLDPSMGDAQKILDNKESLQTHLKKGGIWVYPILGFALLSTLIAVYKFFQIFTIRQPQADTVQKLIQLIQTDKIEEAKSLANQQPHPSKQMLQHALDHIEEPPELIEEVMLESVLETQPRLERFLNIIAVTAAIAPLLGLLGTVTGIIKTFKLMEIFGSGDPKPLISGISEALITTELGLILAIPALILHAILSRRVSTILGKLEQVALALTNGLSRKKNT